MRFFRTDLNGKLNPYTSSSTQASNFSNQTEMSILRIFVLSALLAAIENRLAAPYDAICDVNNNNKTYRIVYGEWPGSVHIKEGKNGTRLEHLEG